jgi:hypothetical protein
MDELLALWRTYEGERVLITDQHELRQAVGGGESFEDFFQRGYEAVLQRVLQM